jgi:exodeoxyribonuclease VII small subunit
MSEKNNNNFNNNIETLEKIVKSLESGETHLEESLEQFELGLELYKKCKKQLEEVESKIKVLTEDLNEEDY